jgi:hypothetical protein
MPLKKVHVPFTIFTQNLSLFVDITLNHYKGNHYTIYKDGLVIRMGGDIRKTSMSSIIDHCIYLHMIFNYNIGKLYKKFHTNIYLI